MNTRTDNLSIVARNVFRTSDDALLYFGGGNHQIYAVTEAPHTICGVSRSGPFVAYRYHGEGRNNRHGYEMPADADFNERLHIRRTCRRLFGLAHAS